MKKFFLLLTIVLVVAAVYVYQDPQLRERAEKLPGRLHDQLNDKPPSSAAYKWRDRAGVWQYSSEPPPPGTPYEKVEVRHDVNVLPVPEQLKPKD